MHKSLDFPQSISYFFTIHLKWIIISNMYWSNILNDIKEESIHPCDFNVDRLIGLTRLQRVDGWSVSGLKWVQNVINQWPMWKKKPDEEIG